MTSSEPFLNKKTHRGKHEARRKREYLRNPPKIFIDTAPPIRRTLLASARKTLRRERDRRNYIAPWIRDPTFRLKDLTYPEGHFLALPAEVRQQILRMSLDKRDFKSMGRLALSRSKSARERVCKLICTRVGELASVCPVVRLDMTHVAREWKKKYVDGEVLYKKWTGQAIQLPKWDVTKGVEWKKNVQKKLEVQEKEGKATKRKHNRPHRCRYCDERHKAGDLVCPMWKCNPEKWISLTKTLKTKWKGPKLPHQQLVGKRIIFDDDS